MSALRNKVGIITGASSGVGRATAQLLARQGARLVLGARRKEALDAVVREITEAGGSGVARAGDVREEDYARDLVVLAVESFGSLDFAVNNAGTLGAGGPATEMTLDTWQHTLSVNLTGAFLGAKYQIPEMLKGGGGALIMTSSFVGNGVGFPGMAAYAASKAGLVGLTQVLASEYGPQGVRVNALLPGGIDTPMGREAASTPDAQSWVRGIHALRRIANPEEIAQAALFLCSDASTFMTGAAMVVDGGVSITRT